MRKEADSYLERIAELCPKAVLLHIQEYPHFQKKTPDGRKYCSLLPVFQSDKFKKYCSYTGRTTPVEINSIMGKYTEPNYACMFR